MPPRKPINLGLVKPVTEVKNIEVQYDTPFRLAMMEAAKPAAIEVIMVADMACMLKVRRNSLSSSSSLFIIRMFSFCLSWKRLPVILSSTIGTSLYQQHNSQMNAIR